MHARQRRAMTLIELLISIALGMVLVAMGTSALLHVSQLFKRNLAHLQAHDDAATIHHRLNDTLGSCYHPALMTLRADPGADGAWGSGDEWVELTWMSGLRSLDDGTMGYGPTPMTELLWHRMRWDADGPDGGELRFANSSGRRTVTAWNNTPIAMGPFVRRDRRRDMDDNDLRFLPGMDLATWQSMGVAGDGTHLEDRLQPWHPPTTRVVDLSVELIDRGGYRISADGEVGVEITGPGGATVPSLGTDASNGQAQVLEGAWLDGRDQRPADVSDGAHAYHKRSASHQRPALIRISFELIVLAPGDVGDPAFAPRLPYTITVSTAQSLPPL